MFDALKCGFRPCEAGGQKCSDAEFAERLRQQDPQIGKSWHGRSGLRDGLVLFFSKFEDMANQMSDLCGLWLGGSSQFLTIVGWFNPSPTGRTQLELVCQMSRVEICCGACCNGIPTKEFRPRQVAVWLVPHSSDDMP